VIARDALRRAAGFGPYFAVDLDPSGAGWLPLRLLVDDPHAVRERVTFVRDALAIRCGLPSTEIDARAAASIHLLGLASRLVAPSLAVLAVDGLVVAFGVDDMRWQRVEGGPVPVALCSVTDGPPVADPREAARALSDGVVAGVVAPVVDAFAEWAGVSRIVLWGNVASALAGAASMLTRSDAALRHDPAAIVAALLELPGPLHDAGSFGVDGRYFVRSSCCLFYRIPNGGKCGDCVLL
jgi:ferric iron reductase protein FhuF